MTYHRRAPALVVGATGSSDVQTAVRFAAARSLPVGMHATGHGGTSMRGVVVSTHRMNRVRVNVAERTVRVQAGARWAKVIEAAAVHGLAPLSSSSPGVGVVGYTLGGGVGPLARQYGFAADHVRSIDVVTADGRLRTVDPTHDPDLFWALRGGKGSFGVVTSIDLELFPVARLFGGAMVFAGRDALALLGSYGAWVNTLPEATTTSVALLKLPDAPQIPSPLRGRMNVHVRVAHIGDASEGAALVAPMRRVAAPLVDTLTDMPYSSVGCIHRDLCDLMPTWHDGSLLRELTQEGLVDLVGAADAWFELPSAMIELRHLGGALGRQPAHPNAVCGRDAEFLLGVVGALASGTGPTVRAAGGGIIEAMSAWATPVLPLNYLSAVGSAERTGSAWSADTYRRLMQVKSMYDPDNLFRSGFAVVPCPGDADSQPDR